MRCRVNTMAIMSHYNNERTSYSTSNKHKLILRVTSKHYILRCYVDEKLRVCWHGFKFILQDKENKAIIAYGLGDFNDSYKNRLGYCSVNSVYNLNYINTVLNKFSNSIVRTKWYHKLFIAPAKKRIWLVANNKGGEVI